MGVSLNRKILDSNPPLLKILQRPDIQRVYVHDYAALNVPTLRGAKAALSRRAERALVMAQRGDLVLLERPADADFLDYLEELELGAARESIFTTDPSGSNTDPSGSNTDPSGSNTDPSGSNTDPLGSNIDHPSGSLSALGSDPAFTDRTAQRLAGCVDPLKRLCISTYYRTRAIDRLAGSLRGRLGRPVLLESGSPASMELANRKDGMRDEAVRLGIPVAPGEVVHVRSSERPPADAVIRATRRQMRTTGGVFVRGAWSSSGVDVIALRNPLDVAALEAWLGERGHIDSFLVEALLPVTASPNFQLWIDADGNAESTCVTGQRLSAAGGHLGNVYPYHSEMLGRMQAAATAIGQMLGQRGYRGPLGIDLMEVPGGAGGSTFAFAEANGRVNASTYAMALFERVNQCRRRLRRAPFAAWVTRVDAPVCADGFRALRRRLGGLIYRHDANGGVVPYNTGLLTDGTVDLLFLAHSVSEAFEVEREALDRIRA